MGDLSFAEAGGVVFERDMAFGVVDLETAEAIGVGKFSEGTQLVVGERGLEFEFGFEECHGGIIAKRGSGEPGRRVEKGEWCSSRPSKKMLLQCAGPRANSKQEKARYSGRSDRRWVGRIEDSRFDMDRG